MLRKVLCRDLDQDACGRMLRSPGNIGAAIWVLYNKMEKVPEGEQHLSHLQRVLFSHMGMYLAPWYFVLWLKGWVEFPGEYEACRGKYSTTLG